MYQIASLKIKGNVYESFLACDLMCVKDKEKSYNREQKSESCLKEK